MNRILRLESVVIFFVTLFFLSIGCNWYNPIDRKLDTWTERLCCQNDSTRIKIENFLVLGRQKLILEFCNSFNANDRLLLSLHFKKENRKYDTILDLISNEKILLKSKMIIALGESNQYFSGGSYGKIELEDGDYRLNLGQGIKCGEILFKIKNGKLKEQEFLCIENCRSN